MPSVRTATVMGGGLRFRWVSPLTPGGKCVVIEEDLWCVTVAAVLASCCLGMPLPGQRRFPSWASILQPALNPGQHLAPPEQNGATTRDPARDQPLRVELAQVSQRQGSQLDDLLHADQQRAVVVSRRACLGL